MTADATADITGIKKNKIFLFKGTSFARYIG